VAGLDRIKWTWGAHCSAKGRVLANFILWRERDEFCLLLPRSMLPLLQKKLRMYVMRSKVDIEPDGQDRMVIGLMIDPNSSSTLSATFPVAFPATSPARSPADSTAPSNAQISPGEVRDTWGGILLGLTGDRALYVASSATASQLTRMTTPAPKQVQPAEWDQLSISNGEPWILPATQDSYIPQMLNLELLNGVSFTKGCYPGQEIVARSQHLSEVKRRIHRYRLMNSLGIDVGTPIFAGDRHGQPVGHVINFAICADGAVDFLAVTQRSAQALPLLCGDTITEPLLPQSLPYVVP
jgi:tRNA-modifying protein YgfZ